MTSEVPPSMELARTRRNILRTSGEPMPTRSGRTIGYPAGNSMASLPSRSMQRS